MKTPVFHGKTLFHTPNQSFSVNLELLSSVPIQRKRFK